MLPTLFLSHGAPTLLIDPVPARDFLRGLGATLSRPAAILIVSAHWETDVPMVNGVAVNDTIHDFYGFPSALYAQTYPAPGAPELAGAIADLLAAAGLPARIDHQRGLDHGAWVPLALAWPAHDIPVLQLSVQSRLGPGHHVQVGRALTGLRARGVLVIGSGSFTHNLGELSRTGGDAPEPDWSRDFAAWMDSALAEGRLCDLLTYRQRAPYAHQNHPTEEHLLPLFTALGAAGEGATARRLHRSANFGALRMDAYAFA